MYIIYGNAPRCEIAGVSVIVFVIVKFLVVVIFCGVRDLAPDS